MRLIDADSLKEIEEEWLRDLYNMVKRSNYDETHLAKIDVLEEIINDIDKAKTIETGTLQEEEI